MSEINKKNAFEPSYGKPGRLCQTSKRILAKGPNKWNAVTTTANVTDGVVWRPKEGDPVSIKPKTPIIRGETKKHQELEDTSRGTA